jgi:hypothetical protein
MVVLLPSMVKLKWRSLWLIKKHFDSITDTRIERGKKHNHLDICLLATSSVVSGAEGWEDIEDFGHSSEIGFVNIDLLKQVSLRTIRLLVLFVAYKAQEIEPAFQSCISSLVEITGCDVIAIDGKIARR